VCTTRNRKVFYKTFTLHTVTFNYSNLSLSVVPKRFRKIRKFVSKNIEHGHINVNTRMDKLAGRVRNEQKTKILGSGILSGIQI